MPVDQRLRRAAGVMLWHLTRSDPQTKQRYTEASAVAKASAREPELSEDELAYCLDWARASLLHNLMLREHTRRPKVSRDETGKLVVDWSAAGPEERTLGHFMDRAGLTPFMKDQADG